VNCDAAKKVGHAIDDLPDKPPRGAHSTSDMSISSNNANQQQAYDRNVGHGHSSGHNIPSSTSMTAPTYGLSSDMSGEYGFSGFDPMMQYDQYFPSSSGIDPASMHYAQHSEQSGMQYDGIPTDAEMNFMNTFTEPYQSMVHITLGGGNRSGRSGFG